MMSSAPEHYFSLLLGNKHSEFPYGVFLNIAIIEIAKSDYLLLWIMFGLSGFAQIINNLVCIVFLIEM